MNPGMDNPGASASSRRGLDELGDTALLALELATLWQTDDRGRLCGSVHPWPQLAIAVGGDGRTVTLGSDVPDALADELRVVASAGSVGEPVGDPPTGLDVCARLLGSAGEVTVTAGPSFVVPASRNAIGDVSLRQYGGESDDLVPLRPAEGWEPGEWRDLVSGGLGPWAMWVENRQVTALCHSSRLTSRATEAGVWTHPDLRRQGRAAAVTAAWGGHPDLGDRVRFYSTSADNSASRGVAARLGLRPIGWIWKLSVERATW